MISGLLSFASGLLLSLMSSVFSLLPSDPFIEFIEDFDITSYETFLSWLNFIVPVSDLLTIALAWASSLLLYNCFKALVAWVRR